MKKSRREDHHESIRSFINVCVAGVFPEYLWAPPHVFPIIKWSWGTFKHMEICSPASVQSGLLEFISIIYVQDSL